MIFDQDGNRTLHKGADGLTYDQDGYFVETGISPFSEDEDIRTEDAFTVVAAGFDPNQPRDDQGEWSGGGGRRRNYVDARAVSNALRKAGFQAARSSATRIRGAPRTSPGFEARRFNPLETKDRVVKVWWEQGEWSPRRPDTDFNERAEAMQTALEEAGFTVERQPGGQELYVWRENDE